MSYTRIEAQVTLPGLGSVDEAIATIEDWIVNNSEDGDIPKNLLDYGSDDLKAELRPYLSLTEVVISGISCDDLTISLDNESNNHDPDLFRFIFKILRAVCRVDLVRLTWVLNDSREGLSTSVEYYNRECVQLDLIAAIRSIIESDLPRYAIVEKIANLLAE